MQANLSGNSNFRVVLVTEGAPTPIRVIEDDGDGSLGDPGLALLVHELLKIRSPNLLQIRDPQDEANRVENVRLARPVQPRYRVEVLVESRYHGPRRVRLEPLQAYLLDVHGSARFLHPIETLGIDGIVRSGIVGKISVRVLEIETLEMELNFESENYGDFSCVTVRCQKTTKAGKCFRFGFSKNSLRFILFLLGSGSAHLI